MQPAAVQPSVVTFDVELRAGSWTSQKSTATSVFFKCAVLTLLLFFILVFSFSFFFRPHHRTKNMSALATQTKTPTDVESQAVTQAIASWGEKIANIDTQITDVRVRREAADLDTSVESDAIEDECSAELRRLKKERCAIGAQVTNAMHDLSALAQNSGFVVPSLSLSSSSPGESKTEAPPATAPTKDVSFLMWIFIFCCCCSWFIICCSSLCLVTLCLVTLCFCLRYVLTFLGILLLVMAAIYFIGSSTLYVFVSSFVFFFFFFIVTISSSFLYFFSFFRLFSLHPVRC